MTTRNELKAFEEDLFEQILDVAKRMPSIEDKQRIYALVWALRKYIITIKRKRGFGD